MNLPSVIPVMLLPQCNVFPLGMLPLYIFEPRYRAMLRHALESDRMLCIGNLAPAPEENAAESDDRISEFSTAAIIRACVGNEDGTSHLMLQGMQRVRLLSWEQYEPFRIARIAPLETATAHPEKAAAKGEQLKNRIMGLIKGDTGPGRQLVEQLKKLDHPDRIADFVAGNLIRDAAARHPLLGMTEVEDRLDFLLDLIPAPLTKPAGT